MILKLLTTAYEWAIVYKIVGFLSTAWWNQTFDKVY